MMQVIFLVVGLAIGLVVGWLWANARLFRQFQEEREQRVAAETRVAEMERQQAQARSLVEETTAQLRDVFKALSSDALRENRQAFVERAGEVLDPVREALKRYEDHLREIEQKRSQDYGSLDAQIRTLLESERQLRQETGNLVTALRRPEVRGQWGELTLHRAVELAGMVDHVDYVEQPAVQSEGGALRPDMVVYLPGGRRVVVDAKVSLDAYLNALEAADEEARSSCLTQHCRQMREHIRALSAKSYWQQFEPTPEFVVMFVPGESFLHAACSLDPTLIEQAMQERVMLASPTTLVALLHAVAYGWRQEQIARSTQEVSNLGRELHDRIRTFVGHMENVGKGLDKASAAFNQAVGSLETRVLPAARRFRELGAATGEEIPELEPIDTRARELALPEPLDDKES